MTVTSMDIAGCVSAEKQVGARGSRSDVLARLGAEPGELAQRQAM